jgi:two-component sensor histidine kinase
VELVVSELVTNAVHASLEQGGRPRDASEGGLACVQLQLSSDGALTLIEVQDDALNLPSLTQASPDDETGRGLMLVAALSRRWGWDSQPLASGGKTVWALIEVS